MFNANLKSIIKVLVNKCPRKILKIYVRPTLRCIHDVLKYVFTTSTAEYHLEFTYARMSIDIERNLLWVLDGIELMPVVNQYTYTYIYYYVYAFILY